MKLMLKYKWLIKIKYPNFSYFYPISYSFSFSNTPKINKIEKIMQVLKERSNNYPFLHSHKHLKTYLQYIKTYLINQHTHYSKNLSKNITYINFKIKSKQIQKIISQTISISSTPYDYFNKLMLNNQLLIKHLL